MSTPLDKSISEPTAVTLLIVDDDNITRKTLAKTLGKVGYNTIEASTGVEALSQFEQFKPDMVLMDVMMPEMDGYTACRELRDTLGAQHVPILLLTGLNDVQSVEKAFECGATDFITKPVNWSLLTQRVKYSLRTQRLYAELIKKQSQLFRAQKLAKLGYYEYFLQTDELVFSEILEKILGLNHSESLEKFLTFFTESDAGSIKSHLRQTIHNASEFHMEHEMQVGAETRYVHHFGEPLRDSYNNIIGVACVIQDITERRRAQETIDYQSNYDRVTGLPNRHHFQMMLEQLEDDENLHALLVVELDRVREHTAVLGHQGFDRLLKLVSEDLNLLQSERVKVAYVDGASFAVLLEDIDHVDTVSGYVEQILGLLHKQYYVNGFDIFASVSIGHCLFPLADTTAHSLLKDALAACHEAKRQGGNMGLMFSPGLNTLARNRLSIEAEMRRGMERGEFEVYYQPKIRVQDKDIAGMEALLRWEHPRRGLVSPLEFIPVAEETGLIHSLGHFVLQTACEETRKLHAMGYDHLRIGVNVSPVQFNKKDFLEDVKRVLAATGLPPSSLGLEITESLAMQNIDNTLAVLGKAREMGVLTYIDDFGTGHSSLSILQKLPVDFLKIDRSFIKEIDGLEHSGILAKTIIAMAQSLNLRIIAEGIETIEQYKFLLDNHCDLVQGFLFSKPLPYRDFENFLALHYMDKAPVKRAG
ncbi:MAG: EAL domain-containing protein [Gammaproteobacteria bacterium]|nr:EAL domain-containing protein [Gammaproteobacteria bacterium]MDH5801209.1 EAL domain-containing protein [Gammaproteobacteria bacterium]